MTDWHEWLVRVTIASHNMQFLEGVTADRLAKEHFPSIRTLYANYRRMPMPLPGGGMWEFESGFEFGSSCRFKDILKVFSKIIGVYLEEVGYRFRC